jgi:hypothetical protein
MRTISRARPSGATWIKSATIWSFVAVGTAAFGAAGYIGANRAPDADALCRKGQAVASTAVVLDTTDRLTATQRDRAEAAIIIERNRLPGGGRLTLVAINATSPWEPVQLVSVCNPGVADPADPTKTASHVEKRWKAEYAEPIAAAFAKAYERPPSPASPIIVTVAALLTRPDFDGRASNRRLVLISDLLEHQNGGYSQLKGGDFARGYATSALARQVTLDLRGVAVAIDYLLRPEFIAVQGGAHREFWRKLMTDAGAASVSFVGQENQKTAADGASNPPNKRSGP